MWICFEKKGEVYRCYMVFGMGVKNFGVVYYRFLYYIWIIWKLRIMYNRVFSWLRIVFFKY